MDVVEVRAQVEAALARAEEAVQADQHEVVLNECRQALALLEEIDPACADARLLRGRTLSLQGEAWTCIDTPEAREQGRIAHDAALSLLQGLDLHVATHRHALGNAQRRSGNAWDSLGTPAALQLAIGAYDVAIETLQTLDQSVLGYRRMLANVQMNRGNAWRSLGTPAALQLAIEAHGTAIETLQALDLSVPDYRHDLAGARMNQGNAWRSLGTPAALQAAIDAYGAAIEILQSLDSSVPAYRDTLASAQANQGIGWYMLGTPAALQLAIKAHGAAIEVLKDLDLSMPKHRYTLAKVQWSQGNACYALSTPAALQLAIKAYGAAIETLEALDLSVPDYRQALANAQVNQGNAWYALGTPAALQLAIKAHGAAIEMLQVLDLSVPGYRHDLAKAQMNQGNVWCALGTPAALQLAVEAHGAAIETLQVIYKLQNATANEISIWPLDALDIAVSSYGNLSNSFSKSGNLPGAVDAADAGLALLRTAEQIGIRRFRHLREKLFKIAIDAYLNWRQPQFLPELIDEHLDPDQPGSAPASAAMQQAALDGLHRALAMAIDMHRHDLAADMSFALQRLREWHRLYFAGTATAARLQAFDAEQCGDPQRAHDLLTRYTRDRPTDPEGWAVLADFELRRGPPEAALAAWQQAAGALIVGGAQPDAVRSRRCGELAQRMLELKFVRLADEVDGLDRDGLLACIDQLLTWLQRDFLSEAGQAAERLGSRVPGSDAWRTALAPVLDEVWAPFAERRRHWLDLRDAEARTRWLDAEIKTWREALKNASRQLADTLGAGLTQPWREFVAMLGKAFSDLALPPEDGDRLATGREAQLIEALSIAARRASEALDGAELAAIEAALQARLGPVWDVVLDEPARRYLACARRCLDEPALQRYAGLELGLSVEHLLLTRLYKPLRAEQGPPLPDADPIDVHPDTRMLAFLKGDARVPMLGVQISVFNRALSRLDAADKGSPLYERLCALLSRLPAAHHLRTDPVSARVRRKRLEIVRDCRNDCAHPNTPTVTRNLFEVWREMVEDAEHGFVQYFGRAHLYG